MILRGTLLMSLLLTVLCASAWAQDEAEVIVVDELTAEADALPDESEADDEPAEPTEAVEVSLMDELAEHSAVTVIDGAQLESARSLAEVLERVPGLDVRMQGGAGQLAVAHLRGGYAEQTLVLLDGAPLSPGRATDLSELPLAGVERVEVLRGPEAARYGLGALGGVINVVTTRAEDSEHSAMGSFRSGSHGLTELSLSGRQEHVAWSVSHLQAENNFSFRRANGEQVLRQNNEAEHQQAWANWGSDVRYRVGLSRLRRGVPGSAEFPTLDARLARDSVWLQADGARWRGDFSLTDSRFHDPQPYLNTGPIDSADTRMHLEASYGALALKDGNFGLRPRLDRIDSRQYGERTRAGLDALWLGESSRGCWTHRFELGAAASSDVGIDPLARWSVSRPVGCNASAYASVGYAVRHPDFEELYLTNAGSVQGNPELQPERLLAGELGYRWRGEHAGFSAAAFWNAYDDSIIFAPVSSYLVRAVNTGAATVAGAEAELEVELSPVVRWHTAATWLPLAELDSGVPLPGRAEHRLTSELALAEDDWRGALALDWTGAMTADLFGNLRIPKRTLVDLRLGREFAVGDCRRGSLDLDISNLFDRQTRDSWHYPLPGREFSLTWRTDL